MPAGQEKDFIIKFPVDLATVDAWDILGAGLKLPEGEYDVIVESLSQRAQKGDMVADEVSMRYRVISGEFDGQKTMPDRFSLSEKVMGKWVQFLMAINPGKEIKGPGAKSKNIRGKKLKLRVFDEEHKGQWRNKFTDYQPFDENEPAMGASGASSTGGGNGQSGPAGAAPDDDDNADLL